MLVSGDSDKRAKRSYISTLVGADDLHWQGIDGQGVGVAVIDTTCSGRATDAHSTAAASTSAAPRAPWPTEP